MTAITTLQTRVVIDHIRGTSAGLAAANPTVGYGVFVLETDADRGKFGDGLTAYNDLPYFAGEATWSSLSGKPFSSIGSGLSVVAGVLSASGLTSVSWGDVTGKPSFATVATTGLYSDLSGVPATFPPSAHSHIIANTTGLQAALDAKAPLASPAFTGTVSGVSAAMVGLGSVDNTADSSKPVSTAQAAADAAVQAYAIQRVNHTGTQSYTTITGLGTLATQDGTFSGTSSGTNTGDQTITLTGDVTGSGTGSFAATLSASGVTAGTYTSVTVDEKGRVTAGSSPTTLSGYGITDGVTTSDARLTDARTPTGAAGGDLTGTFPNPTIADGAVTLAKSTGLQKTITVSSAAPTGGSSGDLYVQTSAAGQVTPATLTADANDYAPSAGDIYRISSNAARNITGWTAWTDGTVKLLVNVGGFAITLKHQSTSSSASNRFITPTAGDYVLPAGGSALIYWDATDSRVRAL